MDLTLEFFYRIRHNPILEMTEQYNVLNDNDHDLTPRLMRNVTTRADQRHLKDWSFITT